MYKYIGLTTICLMASTACAYTSCVGGTEITTNTSATNSSCIRATGVNSCNGMRVCISNRSMNWWSAMAWCQSNGGTLISMENAHPNSSLSESCENFRSLPGFSSGWTSKIAPNSSCAYAVQSDTNRVCYDRTNQRTAICQ